MIKRHKKQLFDNHPAVVGHNGAHASCNGFTNGVTNGVSNKKPVSVPCFSNERDSNGISTNLNNISCPDDKTWSAASFEALDEYFTRLVIKRT